MKPSLGIVLFGFAFLALEAGCFIQDDPSPKSAACNKDSDCDGALTCHGGACIASNAQGGASGEAGSGGDPAGSGDGGAGGAPESSAGTGGGAPCDNSGSCQTCAECAQKGNCSVEVQECGMNSECAAIVNCVNDCAASDDGCAQDCYSSHPDGQAGLDALIGCITAECQTDCNN